MLLWLSSSVATLTFPGLRRLVAAWQRPVSWLDNVFFVVLCLQINKSHNSFPVVSDLAACDAFVLSHYHEVSTLNNPEPECVGKWGLGAFTHGWYRGTA